MQGRFRDVGLATFRRNIALCVLLRDERVNPSSTPFSRLLRQAEDTEDQF